jgi:hypothetical protein
MRIMQTIGTMTVYIKKSQVHMNSKGPSYNDRIQVQCGL